MTDVFTPDKRSYCMSRVKSGNTKPELLVRSLVHRMGFRFRLHRRDLPGCPDMVLPRLRRVIFVHGCFWHGHEGCPRSARPSTNREFWDKKLSGNVERDKKNLLRLKELGWKTLVVWGCETKNVERLNDILRGFLYE
jgi:DNA mismatch endonuclease, patch repair protein